MMKRLFSSIFVAIACCMALSAGNRQKENDGNWYIMSGYGYSVMLGEMLGLWDELPQSCEVLA